MNEEERLLNTAEWRGTVNARLEALSTSTTNLKRELDLCMAQLTQLALKLEVITTKVAFVAGIGAIVGGGIVSGLIRWLGH